MSPSRLAVLFVLLVLPLAAQTPRLDYYLPDAAGYEPSVPPPAAVLGFEVGDWHLRPDQIADYARRLAESSDRVSYRVYGRTHERRPLVLLTISAPENLARLDAILAERGALFDPARAAPETAAMPLVAWMGYSVHGDEPSGASAALLLAYRLAAAHDEKTAALLRETVILLDPCLNPDGLARFANWANGNRGLRVNDDPRHREHRQPWPGGRTNHYWFDLNRDWLLARQPESRARLELVQAWRPNLVTDYHEMGTNSTYFFQPGVRSRMNPLSPAATSISPPPSPRPTPARSTRSARSTTPRRPSTTSTSARARPTRTCTAASASSSSRRAPAATPSGTTTAGSTSPSRSGTSSSPRSPRSRPRRPGGANSSTTSGSSTSPPSTPRPPIRSAPGSSTPRRTGPAPRPWSTSCSGTASASIAWRRISRTARVASPPPRPSWCRPISRSTGS